jgi:Tetratricopeptide repeat
VFRAGQLQPYHGDFEPLECVDQATWYLLARGDLAAGLPLATELYTRWRGALGDDHPDTLNAARTLAQAYRDHGRFERARRLDEDTLARSRRVLGEDHPDTLSSANNLAIDLRALGQEAQARALEEQIRRLRAARDEPLE